MVIDGLKGFLPYFDSKYISSWSFRNLDPPGLEPIRPRLVLINVTVDTLTHQRAMRVESDRDIVFRHLHPRLPSRRLGLEPPPNLDVSLSTHLIRVPRFRSKTTTCCKRIPCYKLVCTPTTSVPHRAIFRQFPSQERRAEIRQRRTVSLDWIHDIFQSHWWYRRTQESGLVDKAFVWSRQPCSIRNSIEEAVSIATLSETVASEHESAFQFEGLKTARISSGPDVILDHPDSGSSVVPPACLAHKRSLSATRAETTFSVARRLPNRDFYFDQRTLQLMQWLQCNILPNCIQIEFFVQRRFRCLRRSSAPII